MKFQKNQQEVFQFIIAFFYKFIWNFGGKFGQEKSSSSRSLSLLSLQGWRLPNFAPGSAEQLDSCWPRGHWRDRSSCSRQCSHYWKTCETRLAKYCKTPLNLQLTICQITICEKQQKPLTICQNCKTFFAKVVKIMKRCELTRMICYHQTIAN